jgi:hypothetical protein
MNGVFDSSGDKTYGPSGEYSGGGFGRWADENADNIADPAVGFRFGPGPQTTPATPTGETEAGRGSDTPLTWQQRALQLLSMLQIAKGYNDLPPKLRKQVSALIDDAPNDAR